jgi:hypothetical protein
MRWVAPWVLSLVLAVALVYEWRRGEAAREETAAVRAASAESASLYLDLKAEHAKWLTMGLRKLRVDDEPEGFQILDSLLASSVRGLDSSGPRGEVARDAISYLAEVGNPWNR